ncbi:MAG TPA: transglutaminase-like domain-containing protein, partial [Vicinamibacterales bacterium]
MNRREFLAAAALMPRALQSLQSDGWRVFEITTHVHVQNASGVTRAWLPTPLVAMPYQQTLGDTYQGEGGASVMVESEEIDMLFTEWPAGTDPILTLTSRVATRDYAVDLSSPSVPPPPDLTRFSRYLRPTKSAPIDDAAKLAAERITRGAGTDIEKARAIFDHVAQRPAAEPTDATRHEQFVGVARAAGIPARPVYGLRLGSRDATRAQECRAETYLVG